MTVAKAPETLSVAAPHVPSADQPNPADVHASRLPLPCTLARSATAASRPPDVGLLRAPEIFKVGVAGAPVTDWAVEDTHSTRR